MSSLAYRKDIDGLRAIAVLSVIICHANPDWLPGGFTGVDVFFVISGFLITAIIQREMTDGSFRFADFYLRRIRRILPVFFVVLFVVLLAGTLLLLAKDLVFVSSSARYATFFASNLYFAGEVDYFAPATVETPLIHTWSLAVEEQYYLVWPVLLLLLLRYARRWLVPLMLLMMLASFVLASLWAMDAGKAMWSFYSLPTRMGELLVGSLLAFVRPPAGKAGNLAGIGALLLLAASFVLLDKQSVFPGYNALWPCLGAALLIYAGMSGRCWSSRLLSVAPMVWIGRISYSLYLWHWPVLAYARYYTQQHSLSPAWLLFCAVLTLLLSALSWRYVEQPFRRQPLSFAAAARRFFLLPALLVLLFGAWAKHSDGHLFGNTQPQLTEVLVEDIGCVYKLRADCRIAGEGRPETVVFGDSHAKHYALVFAGIGEQQGIAMDFLTANSCPFMLDPTFNQGSRCQQLSAYVSQQLPHYRNIIVALRWSEYLKTYPGADQAAGRQFEQQLAQWLAQWTAEGRQVLLVSQAPEYQRDVQRNWRHGHADNTVLSRYAIANQRLQQLAQAYPQVVYLDFATALAGWQNGFVSGLPAYVDSHHLNAHGQQVLLQQLGERPLPALEQPE